MVVPSAESAAPPAPAEMMPLLPEDAPPVDPSLFPIELIPLDDLRPHPRNYRSHPEDQIVHLRQSWLDNGWYKNVVIAEDGTILAGHGICLGARAAGATHAPVRRMPLPADSPRALKILATDNEVSHLAQDDDRALSELLREVRQEDPTGLLGTGYDDAMLATLVMVTRPAGEIKDEDEAAHWVGLPDYQKGAEAITLTLQFDSLEDRDRLIAQLGVTHYGKRAAWWPPRPREDPVSLKWTAPPAASPADPLSPEEESIARAQDRIDPEPELSGEPGAL